MKAILIDPVAETVTEVEHNGDYKQIYKFLSDEAHGLNVDTFATVDLHGYDVATRITNSLFVDHEGLLKDPKYFFTIFGYRQPLSGRGLVLGCDEECEMVATTLTADELRPFIAFFGPPPKED